MSSIISELPPPLDKLVIENEKGSYKDFQLKPGDAYPLAGITYPVDYGCLPGYNGEDGHELDFLVGSDAEGKSGYILIWRNDVPTEHKYYVSMTEEELSQTLEVFKPVTNEHVVFATISELLSSIALFKINKNTQL